MQKITTFLPELTERLLVTTTSYIRSGMNFFLTVTPGFEDLALQELQSWLPELKPEQLRLEHGGLNLETDLRTGLELNRCLRLPTRILVRIAEFGCRDFPKLFKKLSTMAWDEWIPDLKQVDFQVSTHGSRVKMKKRIEETCLSARIQYLKKKGRPHSKVFMGPEADFTLYVRFDHDVCMVSLDTSGERLHKRGVRTQSSEAPLRETFAAGLLSLMEGVDQSDRSDKKTEFGTVELVDPMMGGATFLLEAAGRRAIVESRHFSYLENPALLARIEREESQVIVHSADLPQFVSAPIGSAQANVATLNLTRSAFVSGISPYASLIGYEISSKSADAAEQNLRQHLEGCGRGLEVSNSLVDPSANHKADPKPDVNEGSKAAGAPIQVRTYREDFFKSKALARSKFAKRWVVCNPPYGERLHVEGPLGAFYERLMAQMESTLEPDLACLLLPQKAHSKSLKIPAAWRFRKALKFSNGGLPVEAVIYTRRR